MFLGSPVDSSDTAVRSNRCQYGTFLAIVYSESQPRPFCVEVMLGRGQSSAPAITPASKEPLPTLECSIAPKTLDVSSSFIARIRSLSPVHCHLAYPSASIVLERGMWLLAIYISTIPYLSTDQQPYHGSRTFVPPWGSLLLSPSSPPSLRTWTPQLQAQFLRCSPSRGQPRSSFLPYLPCSRLCS